MKSKDVLGLCRVIELRILEKGGHFCLIRTIEYLRLRTQIMPFFGFQVHFSVSNISCILQIFFIEENKIEKENNFYNWHFLLAIISKAPRFWFGSRNSNLLIGSSHRASKFSKLSTYLLNSLSTNNRVEGIKCKYLL